MEQDMRSEDGTGAAGEARIAAALGPAEAKTAREGLLAALAAAREGGRPLFVELKGGPAFPCALQLLVAAEKSAAAADVPFRLGPAAAEARDTLTLDARTEQESQ
jgi:hypothetical protein